MDRFLTRRYVAVTCSEAIRLARLDGTPWSAIRRTPDIHLIHRTDWWAWWSDERLTTSVGLPESLCPEELSPDAVALISEVWESESPAPQCGWAALANVHHTLERENLHVNRAFFPLQVEIWRKLSVQFRHGEQGVLYGYWKFAEGDYQCDISQTLSALPEQP